MKDVFGSQNFKKKIELLREDAKAFSTEALNIYESLLIESPNKEAFQNKLNSFFQNAPQFSDNKSIELLVEYFSGYIDRRGALPDHDVPSLVIFDTNCLQIIEQKTQKIFDNEATNKKDGTITATQAVRNFVTQPGIQTTMKKVEEIEQEQNDKTEDQKIEGEILDGK